MEDAPEFLGLRIVSFFVEGLSVDGFSHIRTSELTNYDLLIAVLASICKVGTQVFGGHPHVW